jgi:hypothetical protein
VDADDEAEPTVKRERAGGDGGTGPTLAGADTRTTAPPAIGYLTSQCRLAPASRRWIR